MSDEYINAMEDSFVYSLDGEFFDDFDSVMCIVNSEYEPGERVVGCRGVIVRKTHSDYINKYPVESFIEMVQEMAYDIDGDFAETYCDQFTDQHTTDLRQCIIEFFDKNIPQPTNYGVSNVEEYLFISEEE